MDSENRFGVWRLATQRADSSVLIVGSEDGFGVWDLATERADMAPTAATGLNASSFMYGFIVVLYCLTAVILFAFIMSRWQDGGIGQEENTKKFVSYLLLVEEKEKVTQPFSGATGERESRRSRRREGVPPGWRRWSWRER